jgi:stage II sporulation protein D
VPAFDDATVRSELLAIGLEGPMASATAWQRIIVRALSDPAIPVAHRHLVAEGLRSATREGTADVLHDAGTDTLAKTGTVVTGGDSEGMAVVVRPDEDLDLVVRVRGGAGRDAAGLAASVLARHAPAAQTVRLGVRRETGDVPQTLSLDTYVGRVVAAEATPDMPAAALEAVAVAARTYAVAHRGRHADDGFDLCDSTHCQASATRVWPEADAAARRTRGLVLARDGTVVPVYYSAVCPGRLFTAQAIWGGTAPGHERAGREMHAHPVPTWHTDVTERALIAALHEAGFAGELLRDMRVERDPGTDLPRVVELDGLAPRRVPAHRFRTSVGRALGWDVLKSDTWSARRTAAGFRFEGRGKGHGVGLCVAGATAHATAAGAAARVDDILRDYYPSLRLRSLADTVRLHVTHASQRHAEALLRDAYRALAHLRQQLTLTAPRAITIVEHPSVEAYQRATGRAWWTGGSTRMIAATTARIDLPPLATLARAGSVDVRLRHELVHALTATSLRDAPLWVQEGLAVQLAGGEPMATTTADRCPSDPEMAGPGGLEAMQAMYARAAACVARALHTGTPWRTIR